MTPPYPPYPLYSPPPLSPFASPYFSKKHSAAFTLLEVMVAFSIFAVAFVAVAVLFPAAMSLQRQSLNEIQGNAVENNAVALLKARRFQINTTASDRDLDDINIVANNTNVNPINFASGTGILTQWQWTLSDRTFPTSSPHYDTATQTSERRYVWVPLAQRTAIGGGNPITSAGSWKIFVFILKRELTDSDAYPIQTNTSDWAIPTTAANNDRRFPGVLKITASSSGSQTLNLSNTLGSVRCLDAGDMFLDNNGNTYWVKTATDLQITVDGVLDPAKTVSYIWCSPRPKSNLSSPTVKIQVLTDAVYQ